VPRVTNANRPRQFLDLGLRGMNLQQAARELERRQVEARGLSREAQALMLAKDALVKANIRVSVEGYATIKLTPDHMRTLQNNVEIARKAEEKQRLAEISEMANISKEIRRQWAIAGGALIQQANVQTYQELQVILARVALVVNERVGKKSAQVFNRAVRQTQRYHQYLLAVQELGKINFKLWFKNNGIVPAFLENPERMRRFSRTLLARVEKSVQEALGDAITECIAKVAVNDVAWPPLYTTLLSEMTAKVIAAGKLKIHGASLSGWWMEVDFEKLFGGPNELVGAQHYKAMLASGNKEDTKWRRVETLPSGEPALKNPTGARYNYWKAMAYGQKLFYGGYNSYAEARVGASKSNKGFKKKRAQNKITLNNLRGNIAKNKGDLSKIKETLDDSAQINRILREEKYTKTKLRSRVKGLLIPPNQWAATVQARYDYWKSINAAPIWWYLEFGQLKYPPRIAPQGLTTRFMNKAIAIVDKEVEILFQQELASAGVGQVDTWGKGTGIKDIRGARSDGVTAIQYGSKKGVTQRAGTFLPKDIFTAMNSTIRSTNRNAEEAAKVARTFATPTPPIGKTEVEGSRGTKRVMRTPLFGGEGGGANMPSGISSRGAPRGQGPVFIPVNKFTRHGVLITPPSVARVTVKVDKRTKAYKHSEAVRKAGGQAKWNQAESLRIQRIERAKDIAAASRARVAKGKKRIRERDAAKIQRAKDAAKKIKRPKGTSSTSGGLQNYPQRNN
jgi:hypothetical protein